MQTLYSIKDKRGELVIFYRNKTQRHFAENHSNRNIILKSRQLGITTDETIDSLDDTLFVPNRDTLLIAHRKEDALKIFDNKIVLAWKNLDPRIQKLWRVDTDRANTLKFGFGGGEFSSIAVSTSGRSSTLQRVHISEFAAICANHPRAANEIIDGTFPAVDAGRLDIESTAEGEIGEFYEMFWSAWNRQGGRSWTREMTKSRLEFSAFFYSWRWDVADIQNTPLFADLPARFADYQKMHGLTDKEISYFYEKYLSFNKNWKRLIQNYPTTPEEAFVSSGDKFFDPESVKECERAYAETEKQGDWLFLKKYDKRHRYGLGADVAEGVGGDSSAIAIWDFNENEIAAIYANNQIDPVNLAYEIRDGGNRYGVCLAAPERNNHGHATISKLKEIYPEEKIFREHRDNTKNQSKEGKFGWLTTLASKPTMFHDLNDAINQKEIRIPREVAHEMRMYSRDNLNTAHADPDATNHFDLLTAAAIGWQMRTFAKKEAEENARSEEIASAIRRARINQQPNFAG